MKRIHLAYLTIILACGLGGIVIKRAHAQSLASGGQPATKFAQQVSDCPVATVGYMICPVVPVTGQPFLAMSVAGYNGGVPFAIVTPPAPTPTFTATATSLPAGSSPTVSVSGSGFTFGIPTGPQGIPGPVQSFGSNKCSTWSGGSSGVTESGCVQSTP